MRRVLLAISLAVSLAAVPLVAQTRQNGPQVDPQTQIRNQMRNRIASYYTVKLRGAVALSDEQVFKLSLFIQNFINNRFNAVLRRAEIMQKLAEVRSRPNASAEIEEELLLEKFQVDTNLGNMEKNFIEKIKSDLKPGQAAAILKFNQEFFDRELPKLIDQAREAAQTRPNSNKPR